MYKVLEGLYKVAKHGGNHNLSKSSYNYYYYMPETCLNVNIPFNLLLEYNILFSKIPIKSVGNYNMNLGCGDLVYNNQS